jgi:hypothetical protein
MSLSGAFLKSQMFRNLKMLVVVMLGCLAAVAYAETPPLPEYDVKAAFLFNIVKFIDWPSEAFASSSTPITIGILGQDPFGPILDRLVQGRVINQRRVIIRRASRVGDLKNAHLVFLSPSEASHAAEICATLQTGPVICVGDSEQTAPYVTINFSVEAGRIVFSVNRGPAERTGMKISSKLLNLAKSVRAAITQ